jgi:predicted DNA-binding transcriptional regulator YafY
VSERTIRRYVVALHDIGIPVDGQAGAGGGYRLRPGTRLPPLMLSDEEAAAVVFGLVLAERRGLSGAQGGSRRSRGCFPTG